MLASVGFTKEDIYYYGKYITGAGNASVNLSNHVFDDSRCMIVTQVNENRFASDFRHLSAFP